MRIFTLIVSVLFRVLRNTFVVLEGVRLLLLPSQTDPHFTAADNEAEVAQRRAAKLKPIHSVRGRRAGNPVGQQEDTESIRREVAALLTQ
jgi:hypothetical protein